MTFIYRPYQANETIAAIATPPGEGGIAVIRISGKQALEIAEKVFRGKVRTYASHTAHFGKIINHQGEVIDEGLALVMRAPRSYTGEDTVEIQCHGGSLITRQVLEATLQAGARAALPGEFTFKAFINGKIDLAQAEAVQELIGAKNQLALQAAENQLQGALSKKISHFQHELVDLAAILEAWVDFPEEGLEFASMEEVIASLEQVKANMQNLVNTFHEGKKIQEGLSLCLIGPPNVGKSSLMNALLGKDRAIVTDIPGTTRDLLEDELFLGGLHFRIVDTAGIRETEEVIEQEGIRRSKKAMHAADLILLVMDATRPFSLDFHFELPVERTILIWNKIDLPHDLAIPSFFPHSVKLSAKTGEGLAELKEKIHQVIWRNAPPSKEEIVITNARHKHALSSAISACDDLICGLKTGISPEFLSSDMRRVLQELGTIIGSNISEDILTAIFSKFCIGK
jgi:tRNA modification GTPase